MIRERGHGPRMQVAFKGWERQRNRFHSTASRSNSALFDALILVWKYLFKISDLQSDEITSSYQVTKYVIIRKQIHQVSLLFQVHKHGSAWSSGVSAPEPSCAVFFFPENLHEDQKFRGSFRIFLLQILSQEYRVLWATLHHPLVEAGSVTSLFLCI